MSSVWKYFSSTPRGATTCDLCGRDVKRLGNTSNLWSHLRTKHFHAHEGLKGKAASSKKPRPEIGSSPPMLKIKHTFTLNQKYSPSDPKQKEFDDAVFQFLVEDLRPFSLVEGSGFKKLIQVANPKLSFGPHPPTFFRVKLPRLYLESHARLFQLIERQKASLLSAAFTTDTWANPDGGSYICHTLHYVDEDFELLSWLLFCDSFKTESLDSRLKFLHLPDSTEIIAVNWSSGDGSNIQELSVSTDVECAHHILMSCIIDAIEAVPGMANAVSKCKRISGHVHISPGAKQLLENECHRLGVCCKTLLTSFHSPWDSEFMCLESCLNVKEAIMNLSWDPEFHANALSLREWDMIEDSVSILRKCKGVSEIWRVDSEPTLHKVIPELYDLHGHLNTSLMNVEGMFSREVIQSLEKRFPHCGASNDYYALANILDPRFHGIHVSQFGFLDYFRDKMAVICEAIALNGPSKLSATFEENYDMSASDLLVQKASNSNKEEAQFSQEFDRYLALPMEDKHLSGNDILQWWRVNQKSFPSMSQLVRKYFAIPATSSAVSEKTFSSAGDIVRRSDLFAESTIPRLVFLHKNMTKLNEYLSG